MAGQKYVIRVYPKTAEASAVALHDGTNSWPHRKLVTSFAIQCINDDVHIGDSSVSGEADGFTVKKKQTANWSDIILRGVSLHYDLSKMYYVGGPFKLILEEEIKSSNC